MRTRGFTLVELVMVIVITGILAASLTVFLKPVIDSYFDTRRRADLTDIGDTALRRMSQDIRSAVPNSVRSVSATCFQLVPTIAGGRYRMASDTVNDTPTPLPCAPSATCSAPLDVTAATTVFDVLSPMATVPALNDWIVIGNQSAADVYAGTTRGQISAAPTTPRASDGLHRITVTSTQFPSGYDGGRFVAVPNAAQTVFYSCVGGTLYRTVAAFGAAQAATCALVTGAVVATDVAACTFVYDPNQGATQQSGFGAIAAIVVLVILAALSAAIVSIGTAQQIGSAQDVLSTRAWQTARAGNEWGLFKALSSTTPADPWKTCSGLSQTIDLTVDTGFRVTVFCDSWPYNEGETVPGTAKTTRVYRIRAVACPTATCPDASAAVAGAGYVERTRVVLATN